MKLLLVNTNSQQLKFDASILQREGFGILIANNFEHLNKIVSGKNPEIIILNINQNEYENGNLSISSLVSFVGLIVVIAPKEFQVVSLIHKQFELIQIESGCVLLDDLVRYCNEFKGKEISSKREHMICNTNIKETIYKSIILNRTNNLAFTEGVTYNSEKIFYLLKNNKEKIRKSLEEFLTIIKNSLSLTEEAIKTGKLDILRIVFHDILNLAEYYGATLLFELVLEYKQEKELSQKEKLLLRINDEQRKVYNYYSQLEQNFNSSKQL